MVRFELATAAGDDDVDVDVDDDDDDTCAAAATAFRKANPPGTSRLHHNDNKSNKSFFIPTLFFFFFFFSFFFCSVILWVARGCSIKHRNGHFEMRTINLSIYIFIRRNLFVC